MDDLKTALYQLPKITPKKGFIRTSKKRLMHQIKLEDNESWFKAFLTRLGKVMPSEAFMEQARLRLMASITRKYQPIKITLHGWQRTFFILKRAVASTLVMLIAVTSTLFFVEGRNVVVALDDSYIEITSGSVSVKHANQLIWNDVKDQIQLAEGDLIKVPEEAGAIVHFFDDTELRLNENTLILIDQIAVSPTFGRQGYIKVALHEGEAWVQTLNVEDGYTGFVLSTRDALLNALNASYNIKTTLSSPTSIFVARNKIEVSVLRPETREVVDTFKLGPKEKCTIQSSLASSLIPIVSVDQLTEQDMANQWIQNNLELDKAHLDKLREVGINRVKQVTGTLPGDLLYPIKQAKERLRLALTFNESAEINAQIEIANQRLNEAIILLEMGEQQKGWEALIAYQSLARQIAEESEDDITSKIVAPHQKILLASLPDPSSLGLVKETLNQTAELLANDPVELEMVRLKNSINRLQDIALLVETGDFEAAKDILINNQLAAENMLDAMDELDEETKKAITQELLELRQEELTLIQEIAQKVSEWNDADEQLLAMFEGAEETANENMEATIAYATPLLPELIVAMTEEVPASASRIQEIVDKIYIYSTWQGQQNQIERLLQHDFVNTSSIGFLTQLRDALDGRAKDYINIKILQLQNKLAEQKSKAVLRKIDRSKRLRRSS